MTDKKISQFGAASSVTGADTLPVVQGGVTKKALLSVLATWLKMQITKTDVGLGNADNTSDANKPLSTAAAANHTPNTIYVSKAGNDTTGTGSVSAPYLTVQKAATVIGSAASNGEFNDPTKEFYKVVVDGGVYTETVTFGTRPYILLDLSIASIVGDVVVQFNQGAISGSGLQAPKFSIAGDDLRTIAGGTPTVGVTGNVAVETVGSGSSLVFNMGLKNVGVTGDIVSRLGTGGGIMTMGLYLDRVIYSGDVKLGAGAGSITLYASNSNYSGSNSLGGVLNALVYQTHDVRFVRPVVTNVSHAGARWYGVAFAAGAHDFTGASGAISADANSIESFKANVPSPGTVTLTPLDTARGISITDANFQVKNSSDATKILAMDMSGLTASVTATFAPLLASSATFYMRPLVDATANFVMQNATTGFVLIGTDATIGGANSGIQYANAGTANRAQIKLHSYFNGTSVAGVSTLTSRSGAVGTNTAIVNGQDYSKWTAQAAATTPGSAPISGTFAFKANTVNLTTVTSDYHLQLTNLAGTLQDALYVGSEGDVQAIGTIKTKNTTNTTAPQWALGAVVVAAATVDATKYVEVMLGGTVVKLAVVV